MEYVNNFHRGGIWWFDNSYFDPETGTTVNKPRPGIVVTNTELIGKVIDLQIVWLTTREKDPLPTRITINSAKEPSTALCDKITSVDKRTATYYIGTCTEEELARIDEAISYSVGVVLPSTRERQLEAKLDLLRELYTDLLSKVTK